MVISPGQVDQVVSEAIVRLWMESGPGADIAHGVTAAPKLAAVWIAAVHDSAIVKAGLVWV
jgi:hypothetical protein